MEIIRCVGEKERKKERNKQERRKVGVGEEWQTRQGGIYSFNGKDVSPEMGARGGGQPLCSSLQRSRVCAACAGSVHRQMDGGKARLLHATDRRLHMNVDGTVACID